MVSTTALRCLMTVAIGIVIGVSGMAVPAIAQSVNWSSEMIQLRPLTLGGVRPVVVAVALDPTGQRLAIAGDDHTIRIWDLSSRQVIQRLTGHTDWVRSLCYSSDGSQLASAGNDGRILIWNDTASQPQRVLRQCDGALSAVAFQPDALHLASVGFHEPMRFFDTATGRQLSELKCPCIDMRAIAFSPTGKLMAAGGRNGKIRIWDTESKEIRDDHVAHRQRIRDLKFSPKGTWLASCGEDRRVRIATVDGSSEFMLPHGAAKVMAVAFVSPNRLATGGSDNVIRIWDLEKRQEVERLSGHTGSVMALAFHGEILVSAGFDATVRIWRPQINASSEVRTPNSRIGSIEVFEIR